MKKKYELTEKTINVDGKTLYQIRALTSFGDVKEGDLGGWIESERNLSHNGNAWVYDNAKVCDYARVSDNAWVRDYACVSGKAFVCDYARVCDCAEVRDSACISEKACVRDYARVCDYAFVGGKAFVGGYARVRDFAYVNDYVKVRDFAEVCNNAKVCDFAELRNNAKVSTNKDYIVFKNWWSSGRYFTWTRSNNMWAVGCFYGSGKELIKKAYKDSEKSGQEYERIVRYVESILEEEDK